MQSNFNIQQDRAHQEASLILDAAWAEMQRAPYVKLRLGLQQLPLPDVSFAEAERRSAVGCDLLRRLQRIDHGTLPHELALALRLVSFRARIWSRQADWYWLGLDVRGTGQFGLFLPTAYCGGHLLNLAQQQLASFSVETENDQARYLDLIADYARLIDQFTERTAGQAERGVRMPKAQVMQARALLNAFKASARTILTSRRPAQASLTPRFAARVEERLAACIEPAFDRTLEGLSDSYFSRAPQEVGMRQYPQGEEVYAEFVKILTTLDLTPEQVHACGVERMLEIEETIRGIETECGFENDGAGFQARLNEDPRWRAHTVDGLKAHFQRYIDRFKPRFRELFANLPQATYGVAPLPQALERSMTYGYYDAPKANRPEGLYLFNAAVLTTRPLFHLAALTYHELMPGHHLQFATQQESSQLHPFCRHSFVNAYIEGWAEYAATLAGESGLYDLPEERYGRLMMDAFLTSRLVVDTGMNTLGWSLERAREYMRAHSRLSEAEVLTESVRYSCDIPAQALAYKLGDTQMLNLRERMRRELGSEFDLKQFHSAVLGTGALPISDLEWHIEQQIAKAKSASDYGVS